MSLEVMRYIAVILLGMHGIGHVLGLFPILGFKLNDNHSARSWLMTPILGDFLSEVLLILFFFSATLAFSGAAMALLDWQIEFVLWQLLATGGAAISALGLFLYPRAFPTLFPNVVGAVFVDVIVLAALLWLRWPEALMPLRLSVP